MLQYSNTARKILRIYFIPVFPQLTDACCLARSLVLYPRPSCLNCHIAIRLGICTLMSSVLEITGAATPVYPRSQAAHESLKFYPHTLLILTIGVCPQNEEGD